MSERDTTDLAGVEHYHANADPLPLPASEPDPSWWQEQPEPHDRREIHATEAPIP